MSFSGNILRSADGIISSIVGGLIAIVLGFVALPILEYFFARWVDPTFGARFWVILAIFTLPTLTASFFFAKPVLELAWILITSPFRKDDV